MAPLPDPFVEGEDNDEEYRQPPTPPRGSPRRRRDASTHSQNVPFSMPTTTTSGTRPRSRIPFLRSSSDSVVTPPHTTPPRSSIIPAPHSYESLDRLPSSSSSSSSNNGSPSRKYSKLDKLSGGKVNLRLGLGSNIKRTLFLAMTYGLASTLYLMTGLHSPSFSNVETNVDSNHMPPPIITKHHLRKKKLELSSEEQALEELQTSDSPAENEGEVEHLLINDEQDLEELHTSDTPAENEGEVEHLLKDAHITTSTRRKARQQDGPFPRVIQYDEVFEEKQLSESILNYIGVKKEKEAVSLSSFIFKRKVEPMSTAAPSKNRSTMDTDTDSACEPVKVLSPHPTCNGIHELDFGYEMNSEMNVPMLNIESELLSSQPESDRFWFLNILPGKIETPGKYTSYNTDELSLKTSHQSIYDGDEPYPLDATLSAYLSSSPNVINTYAYCGQSSLTDYAKSTLERAYRKDTPDRKEKVMYARDIAQGLVDVHNIMEGNCATTIYNELNPESLVVINNRVLLSDFSGAEMMRRNLNTGMQCPIVKTDPLPKGPNLPVSI